MSTERIVHNVPEPVREIELRVFKDSRGKLLPIEKAAGNLPFDPVRIFFIRDVPGGISRGNHAVDCRLFIMVLEGSAVLTEYRGPEMIPWELHPGKGLLIPEQRFIVISEFMPDTILAVFASKRFNETRYFDFTEVKTA